MLKDFIKTFAKVLSITTLFYVFIIALFLPTRIIYTYHKLFPKQEAHFLDAGGYEIHQCNVPVVYGYADNTPKKIIKNTQKAIASWNKIYGKELFKYIGIIKGYNINKSIDTTPSEYNNILIIGFVKKEDFNKVFHKPNTLAETKFYFHSYGCESSHILIRSESINYTNKDIENIMRHELGHVLGLDHDDTGIMVPFYSMGENKSIILSPDEIQTFRNIYK